MEEETNEDFYFYEPAKVGEPAPEFTLNAVLGNGEFTKISLGGTRETWTVLFFYPLDFTFICPTEITGFSNQCAEFEALNTNVYGCSTDSVHSHKAWLKDLGELKTPLLSDMTHELSEAYGVLIEEEGIALRGTFIIDPEGILQYANIHSNNVGRSIDETLRVLKALQTGELCPVNWEQGKETLGKA
ncbi:thioredoxin peroxidase [Candidatus Uhrbacteria bacterium CG10_big_fil_rev_8_21_14_0_10_50_16]|uniref:Thioredoxin peroxidase n=1 Tax=Candidatus Uhrbacteria bacterium CG10_big_fil_rev_8_21_14_0_10_50_16 TaxID=1975039 RepID=A0A2H0RPI8_9BACT|nr:MAG: thioredoxin peroxidase [Candidatus Uhrbacteria bacterium CG10_big_fil_rev_8_21_14_0_10_50_16]